MSARGVFNGENRALRVGCHGVVIVEELSVLINMSRTADAELS